MNFRKDSDNILSPSFMFDHTIVWPHTSYDSGASTIVINPHTCTRGTRYRLILSSLSQSIQTQG